MPMIESLTVRLRDLFAGVEGWRLAGADVDISALSYRSDQAGPGTLFFCVPGFVRDGHDFAPDAVARGAAALCVERPLDLAVPQVVVPSVRWAMGSVASAFYGHPSSRLLTVGITGTNGKTTSAFLAGPPARSRRFSVGAHGHGGAADRRSDAAGRADDARSARHPARLRADGRERGQGGRDGGLLARPRPGTCPGHRLPGRRLHQPDPGPSGLPQDAGGLLRRQVPAVPGRRVRVRRGGGGHQRRRPLRAATGGSMRSGAGDQLLHLGVGSRTGGLPTWR